MKQSPPFEYWKWYNTLCSSEILAVITIICRTTINNTLAAADSGGLNSKETHSFNLGYKSLSGQHLLLAVFAVSVKIYAKPVSVDEFWKDR